MDTNWMICLVIAAILAVLTDGLSSSRVAFATKPSFRVKLWNLIVQGWQTNEMAKMPKTNGMIERFNDCIADVLATTRFGWNRVLGQQEMSAPE